MKDLKKAEQFLRDPSCNITTLGVPQQPLMSVIYHYLALYQLRAIPVPHPFFRTLLLLLFRDSGLASLTVQDLQVYLRTCILLYCGSIAKTHSR
jgi:hypothetical protein